MSTAQLPLHAVNGSPALCPLDVRAPTLKQRRVHSNSTFAMPGDTKQRWCGPCGKAHAGAIELNR